MRPPDERVQRLREFGLSDYASRAYLALLDLGTTEARDVSRLARIPLAKIYSTLEQLQEKGLATMTPEIPKKYAPVPFAEFVDRLREASEEEARRLARARDDMEALFPIVGTTQMNDRGGVTVLRGRGPTLHKLRASLAAARKRALLVGSAGTLLREASLRKAFEEARGRGVRPRLILRETSRARPRFETISALADVRWVPYEAGQASNVGVAIVDDETAVMIHFIPDDASAYTGKDVGLVIEEAGMVAMLSHFAERMWRDAAPGAEDATKAE